MEEAIIITATLIGIFIVIPASLFLIIKKIISDRHEERMAMIEKGIAGPGPHCANDKTEETQANN